MKAGFFPPAMGWVNDPVAVSEVLAQLPDAQGCPAYFSEAAPGIMEAADDDKPFLAWLAEDRVRGQRKRSWNQNPAGTCFKAGVKVRMANGSYKTIETIQLNDLVLTAEGNAKRVRHLFVRREEEGLIRFKCDGHYGLEATEEHPVLTKRGYVRLGRLRVGDLVAIPRYLPQTTGHVITDNHRSWKSRLRKTNSHCGTRVYAGCTQFGRKAVTVQVAAVPDAIGLTAGFGRIIGLFLAEGSTDSNKVVWTFHRDEEHTLAANLISLLKSELGAEAHVQTNKGPQQVCRVVLYGRIWSELFSSWCGNGSGLKRMHADLTSGPREFLAGVYQGWLEGDGHETDRFIQGTTISHELALNMYDIANSLGHCPVIRHCDPKPSHGVKKRQRRYDIVVSTGSGKNDKGHGRSKPFQDDKYVWRRVTDISDVLYQGDVYNMEVEGDNSYVVEGIGVHNCVSFGWGRGVNDSILNAAARGDIEAPAEDVATEPIYGGSRVEVGGGRIRGDGSVGAWAAKWVAMWGVLLRKVYGQHDLTKYSVSISRSWGRSGVPDELEPIARQFPVKTVSLVRSAEEAWKGLGNGYLLPICSNLGFASPYRDGFCARKGQWNHCMLVRGRTLARKNGSTVKAFPVQNSWGDYIDGEPFFIDQDGNRVELPEGCFLITWEEMEAILRQEDSFLLSDVHGFPRRDPSSWLYV